MRSLESLQPPQFTGKPLRLVFDIESDGLLDTITKIHCATVINLDTKEIRLFTPEDIEELPEYLAGADQLYGHNIISYDLPAIKKVFPTLYDLHLKKFELTGGERLMDTMVMCRVFWPDIASMDWDKLAKGTLQIPEGATRKLVGAHTLRAWGYRLGYWKGNEEGAVDFHTYTPEMLEYCQRDVLLNVRLIESMFKKSPELQRGVTPFFIWLEHQFYHYLEYQQKAGVKLNVPLTKLLCKYWTKELVDRRIPEMRTMVPDILKEVEFTPKVNRPDLGYVKGVTMTKRTITSFNPRSNDHVISFLMQKYGWEPQEFTKKGKPTVTYEILKKLPYKEAPLLARIKLLMDRLKLVEKSNGGSAWLQCIKEDGRIYGGIIHNGTPTARCRHIRPNLGNIPSTTAIWGKTLRKLFTVPRGYKLVGTDFDSLEMRCLAHVLYQYDGGEFYRMALLGKSADGTDAHSMNRNSIQKALRDRGFKEVADHMAGKAGRDKAKTGFYAWLYGAWPKKLGTVVCEGLDVNVYKIPEIGKCVQEGFVENIKGIDKVIAELEGLYQECLDNRQWPHIEIADGRSIPIRKKSALLNSLLQSLGAVLSKLACVLLLRRLRDDPEFGLPCAGGVWQPVLHVHDEIQAEVIDDERALPTKFANVVAECFRDAGVYLGFRVPITGTPTIGNNWSETH